MSHRTRQRLLNLRQLAGLCLACTVMAANTQAASPQALPQVFLDLSATMQSRVCGELLTGLALGGVQSLQAQQGPQLKSQDADSKRELLYETGAQAVVLLTMSGSLSLPERLKAGEVTQAIEKLAPEVHVTTARYCVERVAAWVRAGQVDQSLMSKAYTQARQLLDSALNSTAQREPG